MNRSQERRTIERAIAGDRAAAGELVRHHQRSVYAYILRMSGRPDVAEDVVQEAFIRVITHIDRFDFRFRFSTWLFTIARRLYLNQAARMKPVYASEALDASPVAGATETDDADLQQAQRRAIDAALQALSIEQREVVVLFHQLDWPIAQIAAHLNMPEGTVKSHLHRGRRRLREALASQPRDLEQIGVALPQAPARALSQEDGRA